MGGGDANEEEEEGRPHQSPVTMSGIKGEILIPPWKGACQLEEGIQKGTLD